MSQPAPDFIQAARDAARLQRLIEAFRTLGHTAADLDPLGLSRSDPDALHPKTYGFEEADLDRRVYSEGSFGLELSTIREVVEAARAIYCGTVGIE